MGNHKRLCKDCPRRQLADEQHRDKGRYYCQGGKGYFSSEDHSCITRRKVSRLTQERLKDDAWIKRNQNVEPMNKQELVEDYRPPSYTANTQEIIETLNTMGAFSGKVPLGTIAKVINKNIKVIKD